MEEQYLLFEKYLTNTLSDEELITFNRKLSSDSNFKEAFILYKETSTFLDTKIKNEENAIAFEANLKKISTNYFSEKPLPNTKHLIKHWYYAVAASLVLFFGIYMYNANSTLNYNDYIKYSNIDLTVRSDKNELFQKAEKAFNSKNFEDANIHFSALLKQDSQNTELKLYNGLSLIELDQFNEADILLKEITNSRSVYKNKANWYLALSKLKQKDYNSCAIILKSIPYDASEYSIAKKLLSKLE